LLSDSYSSLIALGGSHVDQDTIYEYLKTYSTLTNSGKTVILCWIPGHVGIPGNERADRVTKGALSLPVSPVNVSVGRLKMREMKMRHHTAWHENTRHESADNETARHEKARHENAGNENSHSSRLCDFVDDGSDDDTESSSTSQADSQIVDTPQTDDSQLDMGPFLLTQSNPIQK